MVQPVVVGSGTTGSKAGLFRTPISGGVQSATTVHGLPPPALAVRNLMEQVDLARNIIVRDYRNIFLLPSFHGFHLHLVFLGMCRSMQMTFILFSFALHVKKPRPNLDNYAL